MHSTSENEESSASSGSTPLTSLTNPQLYRLGNQFSTFLFREEQISTRLRALLLGDEDGPWFALLTESEDRMEKAVKGLEMIKGILKKRGITIA